MIGQHLVEAVQSGNHLAATDHLHHLFELVDRTSAFAKFDLLAAATGAKSVMIDGHTDGLLNSWFVLYLTGLRTTDTKTPATHYILPVYRENLIAGRAGSRTA